MFSFSLNSLPLVFFFLLHDRPLLGNVDEATQAVMIVELAFPSGAEAVSWLTR